MDMLSRRLVFHFLSLLFIFRVSEETPVRNPIIANKIKISNTVIDVTIIIKQFMVPIFYCLFSGSLQRQGE